MCFDSLVTTVGLLKLENIRRVAPQRPGTSVLHAHHHDGRIIWTEPVNIMEAPSDKEIAS